MSAQIPTKQLPGDLAFEGVTVVPMSSERLLEDQTVVIQDGRIAWIGAASEAEPAPGVQRIDGRGKYLMPGLADMHAHPGDEHHLLLYVAHGVTTIRNMWGMP